MNEEIRFEVGEKYENMKGVFEVVAIHRDSMDIRWESGEEISTSIALQQRIIERMQHEKELAQEQSASNAKAAKSSKTKGSHHFSGFEADDFGSSVAKTAWRGRGQLGGAVAKKLASKTFKFNSWAVLRKPEVHWLDVKRQKQATLSTQAKFYARVDEEGLCFGFHVPAAKSDSTKESDWGTLVDWLKKPENEAWLGKQCSANDLCFRDFSEKGFEGTIAVQNDQWVHCREDKEAPLEVSLVSFLVAAAENGELDLRIEKRMGRATAIEKKQHIADDLAALFGSLAPLYGAVALRNA